MMMILKLIFLGLLFQNIQRIFAEDSVGEYGPYGHHKATKKEGQDFLDYILHPTPPSSSHSFRKVIVPAVYKEWLHYGIPLWATNQTMRDAFGYDVFLYQKSNVNAPNFLPVNQGLESGVYLRYIIDNYHDFPDVAIFVHGWPATHNKKWLNYVKCVRPNATYMHLNTEFFIRGRTYESGKSPAVKVWTEQCWRDVLRINYQLEDNIQEFNRRFPLNKKLRVDVECCSQFVMGRSKVLEKPLKVWQKLYQIIGNQTVCHKGEPDYPNLSWTREYKNIRPGPEKSDIDSRPGGQTQVSAMEHLTHIVYGGESDLKSKRPDMAYVCDNFYPSTQCPGSPCRPGYSYETLIESAEFSKVAKNAILD